MGILLWEEMHFLISWNLQTNTRDTHNTFPNTKDTKCHFPTLNPGPPGGVHGAQGHQPGDRLLLRLLRQQEAELHRHGGAPQGEGDHRHLRLRDRLRRVRRCVTSIVGLGKVDSKPLHQLLFSPHLLKYYTHTTQ